MIQAVYDQIYFKTDKIFENESDVIGLNGKKLVINTDFEEYEHARIYGEVVSVPLKLSSNRLYYQNDIEQAQYGRHFSHEDILLREKRGQDADRSMYKPFSYTPKFITRGHIVMDIKPGDRIYYHYDCIRNKSNYKGETEDGYDLYTASIDKILCVVRDGEIIPIGEWVLIKPVMQSEEEITSKSGIMMQSEVKAKHLLGKVMHIGEPLKGYIQTAKVGDTVIYVEESDWEVEIEGDTYYVMKNRDLLAVLEDNNTSDKE